MSNPVDLIQVTNHPLILHHLTQLRNAHTDPEHFHQIARRLFYLLAYESAWHLESAPKSIVTPLCATTGYQISRPVLLLPVLRAALDMVPPYRELFPAAQVGHLGLVRDHNTLQPTEYLAAFPKDLSIFHLILMDPMLATGGSLCHALETVYERGATDVLVACVVAAREGIERVIRKYPNIKIIAAAVDEQPLNDKGYIVPGLGDFGDRLMGWVD